MISDNAKGEAAGTHLNQGYGAIHARLDPLVGLKLSFFFNVLEKTRKRRGFAQLFLIKGNGTSTKISPLIITYKLHLTIPFTERQFQPVILIRGRKEQLSIF